MIEQNNENFDIVKKQSEERIKTLLFEAQQLKEQCSAAEAYQKKVESMTELISTYESKLLAMKETLEIRETNLSETTAKLHEIEEKVKQKEIEGEHLVSLLDRQAIYLVIPCELLRHVEQREGQIGVA